MPVEAAVAAGTMEITVSKFELLRELTATQGVVERKTTIPILSNYLFEAAGDRAAPGTRDHLLLGELVEVAPDGRLRHGQPLRRLLDAHPTVLGEQLQERVPARVPVHDTSPCANRAKCCAH